MSAQFTVLASGSSGNATLLQSDGFGLLIDCGLSARQLGHRLAVRGLTWRHIHAVILTHTHSDHWSHSALKALATHNIPLYCHCGHHSDLDRCEHFPVLQQAGLVRQFDSGQWINMTANVRVFPHPVSHDVDPTIAFRCEGANGMYGPEWAVGYAADLGEWDEELVEVLASSDLLALEFNHDERMQRISGRPRHLIERVLGPFGHLSNRQGAALLTAILEQSKWLPKRGVVALHRSRECNKPELVQAAVQSALRDCGVQFHLAEQCQPGETLDLTPCRGPRSPKSKRSKSKTTSIES